MKSKSNSSQWIRNKLEDEGIQARNIIKYNLPVDVSDKRLFMRCPHPNIDSNSASGLTQARVAELCGTTPDWSNNLNPMTTLTARTSAASPIPKDDEDVQTNQTTTTTTTNPSVSTTSSTTSLDFRTKKRSAGGGARIVVGRRQLPTTKSAVGRSRLAEGEYRARYWGQMLDTLRRTIDEIYSACETDESEVECKEVIMILEHSKQDFHSLIEKMNLLREYERADAENKPSSLAWDERTILPGKPIMCQVLASAAMETVNARGAYVSIPLNVTPDCSVLGTGDNDSDLGSGTGSWHLVLPKRRSHPITADLERRVHGSAVTPTNHVPSKSGSASRSNTSNSATKRSVKPAKDQVVPNQQQHHTSNDEVASDDFLDVRSDLDAGESEEVDSDADAEEEDGAIPTTANDSVQDSDRMVNGNKGGSVEKTDVSFKPSADEDDRELEEDEEDVDDTTLSRDLRKLDEAIANMTNAERVLSDELDRAQYVEAALRRRFLAHDQSVRHLSGVDHPNTKRITVQSAGLLPAKSNSPQLEELEETQTELDTDVDLLAVDSLLLDDDEIAEEEERLSSGVPLGTTPSLSPLPYAIELPVVTSQNKSSRASFIHSNRALDQKLASRTTCRRCCACQCHQHTHPKETLPPAGSFRSSKHQRSGKNLAREPGMGVDQQCSDQQNSASTALRNEDVQDVTSKAKDLTRSQSVSTLPQTLPRASTNLANTSTDSVQNGIGCMLVSPVVTDHENVTNLSSASGKPGEPGQVSLEEAVRSPPTRLVQAGHQLAAALISAPTPNGLLFVTESNAKSRVPGHGVQMHEKLSARSRRRTTNSIQELEQKQTRARILRQQHLLERAERVHELSKKVEEVHMQKRLLLHQRRSCLERRLHAAERKRQAELERRVLKAHDEETKGREIAFIQTLEAEQKQHSILTKHEESRARLHEIAAKRRRRLEEKLCREEAAKGRRRALEASRRARLDALQARWESRAQQLASRAELLEHSRRAAARAKELNREVKIASLEEQQRTHIEQLRSKIQRKQEESERRHQEQLREISRKAFEMSILTHTGDESITVAGMEPYPIQKWCRACQVTIVSEVALKSHLQGKRHQDAVHEAGRNRPLDRSDVEAFNLLHLVDAPPELLDPLSKAEQDRLKMRRKRARKLRQRMNQRGLQFVKDLEQLKPRIPDSPNRLQLQKLVKDARRFLNLPDSGPWVITRIQAMEKTLNALLRCLVGTRGSEKLPASGDSASTLVDQQICVSVGLLPILVNLIGIIRSQRPSSTQLIPDRTYQLACEVLQAVCSSCPEACSRMVLTNDVSVLVDCLMTRFSAPVSSGRSLGTANDTIDSPDPSAGPVSSQPCTLAIMNCLTKLLYELANETEPLAKSGTTECNANGAMLVNQPKLQDLLGYIVSSGLVDLLATKLSSPRQASSLMRIGSPNTNTRHTGTGTSAVAAAAEQAQRFVLSSIDFLTSLVRLLGRISDRPAVGKTRTAARGKSAVELMTDVSTDDPQASGDGFTSSKEPQTDHLVSSVMKRRHSTSSHDTHPGSSISSSRNDHADGTNHGPDPTKLLETIANTEVFGLIPLLYGLLLDPSSRPNQAIMTPTTGNGTTESRTGASRPVDAGSTPVQKKRIVRPSVNKPADSLDTCSKSDDNKASPFRSQAIGRITLQGLKLLNTLAKVNQPALQSIVSGELTCLLTRHILLSLLSRCATSTNVTTTFSSVQPAPCPGSPQRATAHQSNSINPTRGPEDSQSVTKNAVPCQPSSRKITKSMSTVNHGEDESSLLPSGARPVLIRSAVGAASTDRSNKPLKFSLPSWTSDTPCQPTETLDQPARDQAQIDSSLWSSKTSLTEAVLHETILCVGHLCALHSDNQSGLQRGPCPTLLQRLVALPFEYFSQRPLTDILYPTLIACCYLHTSNLAVLEAELSPTLLANYIEERLLERTMNSLTNPDGKQASSEELLDARFRFEYRFPVSEWNAAKAYFTQ